VLFRQIGGDNTYKLAFDFHDDDADARFCIRKIHSSGQDPDIVNEVFTVDNGVVSIDGKQGTTNTALIVTDSVNATLKIGFPSLRNIAFGQFWWSSRP
jgi:hypothetical protein